MEHPKGILGAGHSAQTAVHRGGTTTGVDLHELVVVKVVNVVVVVQIVGG